MIASVKTARVDLVQGTGLPGLHLLDHLAGDSADALARDARPVDPGEVRGDFPGGQALGAQRQHDLIGLGQPRLPLLDDVRLEDAVSVPWHVDADLAGTLGQHPLRLAPVAHVPGLAARLGVLPVPQMPGRLLVQGGLDDRLGQLLQQPVWAGQRKALASGLAAPAPPPPAAQRTAPVLFVTFSSAEVITAPVPRNPQVSAAADWQPL
jgi:hypothetical protein